MRIAREDFLKKPLRVHSFLHDVPLHDAWKFNLIGGQDRSLIDFISLWDHNGTKHLHASVRLLFGLRRLLGQMFRWDEFTDSSDSYSSRLSREDKEQSLIKPGTPTIGPFHALYAFENERLDETINRTVHAFSAFAMEPQAGGHIVNWAIYVKPVGWFTRYYLTFIDPFRRFLVYPKIIGAIESAWQRKFANAR